MANLRKDVFYITLSINPDSNEILLPSLLGRFSGVQLIKISPENVCSIIYREYPLESILRKDAEFTQQLFLTKSAILCGIDEDYILSVSDVDHEKVTVLLNIQPHNDSNKFGIYRREVFERLHAAVAA